MAIRFYLPNWIFISSGTARPRIWIAGFEGLCSVCLSISLACAKVTKMRNLKQNLRNDFKAMFRCKNVVLTNVIDMGNSVAGLVEF